MNTITPFSMSVMRVGITNCDYNMTKDGQYPECEFGHDRQDGSHAWCEFGHAVHIGQYERTPVLNEKHLWCQ